MLVKTRFFTFCTETQKMHKELGKDVLFKQIFNLTGIFLNAHNLLFDSPISNFPLSILVTSAVPNKEYYHILVVSDILSGKVKPSCEFRCFSETWLPLDSMKR